MQGPAYRESSILHCTCAYFEPAPLLWLLVTFPEKMLWYQLQGSWSGSENLCVASLHGTGQLAPSPPWLWVQWMWQSSKDLASDLSSVVLVQGALWFAAAACLPARCALETGGCPYLLLFPAADDGAFQSPAESPGVTAPEVMSSAEILFNLIVFSE